MQPIIVNWRLWATSCSACGAQQQFDLFFSYIQQIFSNLINHICCSQHPHQKAEFILLLTALVWVTDMKSTAGKRVQLWVKGCSMALLRGDDVGSSKLWLYRSSLLETSRRLKTGQQKSEKVGKLHVFKVSESISLLGKLLHFLQTSSKKYSLRRLWWNYWIFFPIKISRSFNLITCPSWTFLTGKVCAKLVLCVLFSVYWFNQNETT